MGRGCREVVIRRNQGWREVANRAGWHRTLHDDGGCPGRAGKVTVERGTRYSSTYTVPVKLLEYGRCEGRREGSAALPARREGNAAVVGEGLAGFGFRLVSCACCAEGGVVVCVATLQTGMVVCEVQPPRRRQGLGSA